MAQCRSCGREHDASVDVCPETGESVTVGPCGTVVDRYQVEKRLGGGGFGSVYLAKHTVLGQRVALKLLLPQHTRNREVTARFVREARSAASIKSQHIVSVTDFGTTQTGDAFLVMELLDGRDLETILRDEGKFNVEWALRFTEQVLEGLAAAHAASVVHRDMKPANVFVTRSTDGAPWVKLVDFGISKAQVESGTQNLTRTGAMIGTPAYMSPEQFMGTHEVDHRTDLYAVAVILYQMLSGKLPYDADTYERLILLVCTEPPKPLRELEPALAEVVHQLVERGLQRDPGHRFQSANEFKEAVQRALASVTGTGRHSLPPPTAVTQFLDRTSPSQHTTPSPHTTPAAHQTPNPYIQATTTPAQFTPSGYTPSSLTTSGAHPHYSPAGFTPTSGALPPAKSSGGSWVLPVIVLVVGVFALIFALVFALMYEADGGDSDNVVGEIVQPSAFDANRSA